MSPSYWIPTHSLFCLGQAPVLSAPSPSVTPPPLLPLQSHLMSHVTSQTPRLQPSGSINASFFTHILRHRWVLSIPLDCSETIHGSLVPIHPSPLPPQVIRSFVSQAWALTSLLLCGTPCLSVKSTCSSACPVHICSCCSDGFVLFLPDGLLTPPGLLPHPRSSFHPSFLPEPCSFSLLFDYHANRMPNVCSVYNPGTTTYWDK